MEKPDANGFINITWPSKTIPHGGIFHTRLVEPSEAQEKFLKVLLEESKLSIAQRQKCAWALRQEDEKSDQHPKVQMPLVRPRTSRRRSLSAIRESGVFEIDNYRPLKKGEDREKLKEKLANTMAYGDVPDQEQKTKPTRLRVKSPPKLPTAKEMRNDLLTQIRERVEWLTEMEELGQAGPHRDVIKDQIAERLRSLEGLEIGSECTTARSSASGFSTSRSREKLSGAKKTSSNGSSAKSVRSRITDESTEKLKSKQHLTRQHKEENVAVYRELPFLQYSSRRRV